MEDILFSPRSLEFKATNYASIGCATLVILIVILLSKYTGFQLNLKEIYRPSAANRTSLNLQTAIAFVDILRHILIINASSENGSVCIMLAFFSVVTTHLCIFLNVSIAANLQLVYLHGIIPGKKWRIFIYSIPFIVALGVDLIALGFEVYGPNQFTSCFLNEKAKYYEIFQMIQLNILCIPGYIYCLCIFICVMIKLAITSTINIPQETIGEHTPLLPNLQSTESRHFALKISFYPLTCFISHSGLVAFFFYSLFSLKMPAMFPIWLSIGFSSIGTLNLVAFLLDPALKSLLVPVVPESNPENPEPINRLAGIYRARNRPPTPYNSDYEEPNSDDNSDTQSIVYEPHLETPHQRYVRERTEEQERTNNAMPTSF